MFRSRAVTAVLLVAVVTAACTGDDGPEVETAMVGSGEVVQTVATAARIEPASRITVGAPLPGEVEELFVADGDVVASGDPLLRLSEDAVAVQIEQAEAALEAAGSLSGFAGAGGLGFDLAPVFGAFRGTFEDVFPGLLGTLESQVDATEAALIGVIENAAAAEDARADAVRELADAIAASVDETVLGGAVEVDPGLLEGLELGADPQQTADAILAAQVAARDARAQLAAAEAGFRDVAAGLADAEADAAASTEAADEAQAAAVAAQREQAEAALEVARARVDDLELEAPAGGVVELARGDDPAAAGGLGDLGGLADLGDLGGFGDLLGGAGGAGGAGGLGGAGGSSSGVTTSGPIAVGREVTTGQPLVTIYDLSSFTAELSVDEIDIIDVAVGQAVTVLVDAFPGAELAGVVQRVAIAPERGPAGGASYPVTVALEEVPGDVRLRVGLTASAEIEVRRVTGDRVVPTSALLRRGGQEVVYAVRDGRAVEVPVTVDAIGDDTAALLGNIDPGERVVTIGVELVEDGDPIETPDDAPDDAPDGDAPGDDAPGDDAPDEDDG